MDSSMRTQASRQAATRDFFFFLKDPLEILEDTKSVNVLNTPHRVATCRSEMGFRLSAIHVNFYWISF